jgi:hypothetical protein
MGRRKSYPIPAVPSSRLRRNLDLARRAARELSESPWLRDSPEAWEAFRQMFLGLAAMERVHSQHHETILAACRRGGEKEGAQ